MTDPAALKAALGAIVAMPAPSVCATRIARFANEPDNVSLEETQLVAAALAALPTCPKLAASSRARPRGPTRNGAERLR
jgi:hypothetical protein